jgi:hypothetical protein
LGQVRQVPLIPCRESRREQSHCKTRGARCVVHFASQNWLGQTLDVLLVALSKFAQQRFPELRFCLLPRCWTPFELQPLSTMMSGSSIPGKTGSQNKRVDRKGKIKILWQRRSRRSDAKANDNRRTSSRTLEASASGLDPNGTA